MAFLPVDQQNQTAPQGVTTPSPAGGNNIPPQVGGSAGSGSSGAKAGGAPNTASPTQFGAGAQNLQAYLTANAPQITNEANTISNNLNTGYGQVSGDINNTVNQFGQTVQARYAAPNQAVDTAAAANPTGFASTPGNVSAFQGQYNDTYTGPQNFESTTPYSNIQNEVSTAVQDASAMQTPAGLQTYFAGKEQNPTNAETTLDSLLLSGNPAANQQVQAAAGQYANLTPQLANATTAADANVIAAQQQAASAQAAARAAINPVAAAENTAVNNELTAAQNSANTYNTADNAAQSEATALGQVLAGGPSTWGSVPNYSISDWASGFKNPLANLSFNPISQAPTQANVATTQDYATENALAQLIGSGYQPNLSQTNVGQAGTFNVPTNAPTTGTVNTQLAQWLQNVEEPGEVAADQQLNSVGKDVAYAGAGKLEGNQAQFIKNLEAVDPDLAAALAGPGVQPGGGGMPKPIQLS